MSAAAAPDELLFRRPTPADHARVVGVVDEWWGGRRTRALLPRLWFEHFSATSWIVESGDGRLAGFLVGFRSPDHPEQAYVHLIGTDPNRRRTGLGRAMVERFIAEMASAGVRQVDAVTWPGNRVAVAFHRALGFSPVDGPGTQRLYGTPAFPDRDGEGEDRVVFSRFLGPSPA